MVALRTDLHNHLGRNGANPGFDQTIDLVYERLGPNSIFGICNDGYQDKRFEGFINQNGGKYERTWLDDKKTILSVPEKQIFLINVEEVETKQGHFINVGMPSDKKIQKTDMTLTLEDAIKAADDFGTIKITVHPFGRDGLGYYLRENINLLEQFDGWEVYNASAELAIPFILPFNANLKSQKFYNSILGYDYGIGACAFTDGHSPEIIGMSYTILSLNEDPLSIEFIRKAIKRNKTFENLHMKPAKLDAFKHAKNMGMNILFKTAV